MAAAAPGLLAVGAVFVTMTSLEVADYCEDKRELMKDADALDGTLTQFDNNQCALEAKRDVKIMMDEARRSSDVVIRNALDETAGYGESKWTQLKALSMRAMQTTEQAAEALWDAVKRPLVK